jgi:hypothetical protein
MAIPSDRYTSRVEFLKRVAMFATTKRSHDRTIEWWIRW